jgi:hypothetical protein
MVEFGLQALEEVTGVRNLPQNVWWSRKPVHNHGAIS